MMIGDAKRVRLAVVASHPIQYQAPLFRALASRVDLSVFFAHRATEIDQANAGFGVQFDWDVDLLSGYDHVFMNNVASGPSLDGFFGCDTPEIYERLRKGQFESVLVSGWHFKAYVQAALAAKRLGLPLLVRGDSHLGTQRSLPKRIAKALAYPTLLRTFNAALYVGKRSHEYWRHYRFPESRLFFSPHCVDTEWYSARATPTARNALRAKLDILPDTRVLLFVGKMQQFKRPTDLIEAAAQFKARGESIAVIIAGSGPYENSVLRAANATGVSTHLLGFCNQSEMPAIYSAADILVLPSEHETWGIVANEALACGKPIVLADSVGAAPDLAMDEVAGRVFHVGNISKLCAALNSIAARPPSLQAIAAKSQAYSPNAAAAGVEMAVSHCLSRSRDKLEILTA